MKPFTQKPPVRRRLALAVQTALLLAAPGLAAAQDAPPSDATTLDTVTVTGTRIKQTNAVTAQPVFVLDRAKLDKTGVQTVGEVLQQLTASGKALNAKFNSSGNFGYPGRRRRHRRRFGAGRPAQPRLQARAGAGRRHPLGQRVLGLRRQRQRRRQHHPAGDRRARRSAGRRRIGDLRLRRHRRRGQHHHAQEFRRRRGPHLLRRVRRRRRHHRGQPDPRRQRRALVGGLRRELLRAEEHQFGEAGTSRRSRRPAPACAAAVRAFRRAASSSAIRRGRSTASAAAMRTATTGTTSRSNDGTTTPVFDPNDPNGGTYHGFSSADRFNFAPFNLLLTPSKRKALFTSLNYDITDNTRLHVKALYNNRTSTNQAAPEPIFVGPFAGTGGIADTISISAPNPYNPFGIDLDRGQQLRLHHQAPDRGRPAHLRAGRRHDLLQHRPGRPVQHRRPRLQLGCQLRALGEQGRPDLLQRLQRRQDQARAGRSGGVRARCRAACRSTCSAARAGRSRRR